MLKLEFKIRLIRTISAPQSLEIGTSTRSWSKEGTRFGFRFSAKKNTSAHDHINSILIVIIAYCLQTRKRPYIYIY